MYPYSRKILTYFWWRNFLTGNNFGAKYILLHSDTNCRKMVCMVEILIFLNAIATLCPYPVNLGRNKQRTCSGLLLFLLINMLGFLCCIVRYGLSFQTGYQYVGLLIRVFFSLKFVSIVNVFFDFYYPTMLERGRNKKLIGNFWIFLNFLNYMNLQCKLLCLKNINAGSRPNQQYPEGRPYQQTREPYLPLRADQIRI